MDRRDFIKLTAITGTSASLGELWDPEHQLIRFVPDDDIVPGVAEWKAQRVPGCAPPVWSDPSASWTPT